MVYATNPTSSDIELGICNVRSVGIVSLYSYSSSSSSYSSSLSQGNEAWFLARFVASSSSFSTIMKAEAPDEVSAHVKKFALAKILKIDTSQ